MTTPICIKVGHNSDNCSPIIVPVTTPTATVMVYPLDHLLANVIFEIISFYT